ncbi:MAG: HEAT repeat domain-containing protein [Isosphaeraceae bacterium]
MNEPTAASDPSPSRPSPNGHPAGGQVLPPLPDLPPVEAPSAGFIVQLFVIPAVVVLIVILVWLVFGKLAGGERDAMEYVRLIRGVSTNWRSANRAAYELASLIQNDPKLAADPKLLGELTELLEQNLDKVEDPEMTQYLALALGRFQIAEGVSGNGTMVDTLATLARALDAIYPDSIRIAAAMSLAEQAAHREGKIDHARAVAALSETARAAEPTLRQVSVYALGFFGGEAATNALRDHLADENRYARYNAAVALSRRGDPTAAGTVREMLSTADLEKVLDITSADEKRAKIEAIELEALNALQTAITAGKPELARQARREIEALSQTGLSSVRNAALNVLKNLPAAP